MRLFTLALLAAAAVPALAQSGPHGGHLMKEAIGAKAVIFDGYGNGGFSITTSNPRAQAFFDNGMQLAHAFAHKPAVEAMKEAVRLDPRCAMCLWGQAWADGPTINFGKSEDEVAELAVLADKAADLAKDRGTDRERSLIHALQLRYKDGGGGKDGDMRFAKAMGALASKYPEDNEIAVIAADAWLMTKAETPEDWKLNSGLAIPLLQRVLQRNPNDTPAIHFYIHATEAAGRPELAELYADKLAALAPKASHLVHMPSHTYYWVGRYEDAAKANIRAVEIGIDNAKRIGLPAPEGVWGLPYHAHNVTFGLGGALQAGDADIALRLGRPLVRMSQNDAVAEAYRQMIAANGYYALAIFAKPAEVLALPQPKLPFLTAAWHYARGEAFARLDDVENVRKEAAAIHGVTGNLSKDDGSLQAQTMTFIARNVLVGRAEMMARRPKEAAQAFAEAAELEESDDFSSVSDPPAWYYPVRRDLAVALQEQGDVTGARREAAAALKFRRNDPGTLALIAILDARSAAR
jgi:tetratricopeptide (TPR) repeat protein